MLNFGDLAFDCFETLNMNENIVFDENCSNIFSKLRDSSLLLESWTGIHFSNRNSKYICLLVSRSILEVRDDEKEASTEEEEPSVST